MHGLWWFPILWLVGSEIGSALTFHDNLLLASIQTVWPQVSSDKHAQIC